MQLPGVEVRARRRHSRRRRDFELGLQTLPARSTRRVQVKEARKVVEPLSVKQVRVLVGSLRRYRDLAIAYLMLLCGCAAKKSFSCAARGVSGCDQRATYVLIDYKWVLNTETSSRRRLC